jgi:hypothetical protein
VGVSFLLDLVLDLQRSRRLERQRQLTLHRLFQTLQGSVIKHLEGIRPEALLKSSPNELQDYVQATLRGGLSPTLDPRQRLANYTSVMFSLGHLVERGMNRIDVLLDRLAELFEPEFVAGLLEVTEQGYEFANRLVYVEHIRGALESLVPILPSTIKPEERAIGEGVKALVEALASLALPIRVEEFHPMMIKIVNLCEAFIKEQILPRADATLQKAIQDSSNRRHRLSVPPD